MPLEAVKQFNWVDIFVIILVFRVCYISLKNGFTTEFFKLLGIIVALYLSMHYYISASALALEYLPKEGLPERLLNFVVFLILAALGFLAFNFLLKLFNNLVKIETVSTLNKWGGLLLGMARAAMLTSFIIFILVLSNVDYFKKSVKGSYLGANMFTVAPNVYAWIWDNLTSKFATTEKYNNIVEKNNLN